MECFRINKIQGDANKTSLKEGEGIEIEIYSASFAFVFVLRVLTVGKEQQLHLQHEGIHFPHESVQQILPIVQSFPNLQQRHANEKSQQHVMVTKQLLMQLVMQSVNGLQQKHIQEKGPIPLVQQARLAQRGFSTPLPPRSMSKADGMSVTAAIFFERYTIYDKRYKQMQIR